MHTPQRVDQVQTLINYSQTKNFIILQMYHKEAFSLGKETIQRSENNPSIQLILPVVKVPRRYQIHLLLIWNQEVNLLQTSVEKSRKNKLSSKKVQSLLNQRKISQSGETTTYLVV